MNSAFDGSGIDGSLFVTITGFARDTPWLNTAAQWSTDAVLVVFAALVVLAWWRARRADVATMAAALTAPLAVAIGFGAVEVVKNLVAEARPCVSMPHTYIIDTCPVTTDYAFPSGHTAFAAATVGALWVVERRLAWVAALLTVVEGFSRVYVGAHYPHDVVGALVIAGPVALLCALSGRRLLPAAVARLRWGFTTAFVGPGPAAGEVPPKSVVDTHGEWSTTSAESDCTGRNSL
ncbi:phosphatase PAP2 family protein [Nocardia sp. NPDC052254]|uniref:phosphatase PAP2 family protein n=1 Tax=Nocardia sp. NPDC052254 TaxID=3155681 RepID=UPI003439A937